MNELVIGWVLCISMIVFVAVGEKILTKFGWGDKLLKLLKIE